MIILITVIILVTIIVIRNFHTVTSIMSYAFMQLSQESVVLIFVLCRVIRWAVPLFETVTLSMCSHTASCYAVPRVLWACLFAVLVSNRDFSGTAPLTNQALSLFSSGLVGSCALSCSLCFFGCLKILLYVQDKQQWFKNRTE